MPVVDNLWRATGTLAPFGTYDGTAPDLPKPLDLPLNLGSRLTYLFGMKQTAHFSFSLAAPALLMTLSIGTVRALCQDDPPCIEAGKTVDIPMDRPSLVQPGMAVGAFYWPPATSLVPEGAPIAYDEDPIVDDKMGKAKAGSSPDSVVVPVENKGGNMSGPNGDVVNGGLDGDCIEVFVEWTILYPVTITNLSQATAVVEPIEPGGLGGSFTSGSTNSHQVWVSAKVRSKVKEVCPC